MSRPRYTVTPLNVGECLLGQNHVLGDAYSDDDRIPFTLYAFLVDGGPGRRVLVDLGPFGLEYINDMFRRYHFFRDLPGDPDAIKQPHGNTIDCLKRLHLKPEDISHVVFTHMHADHHGLTDGTDGGAILRFPNAVAHVSKIGWQHNLDQRVDGQWNSYVDFAFGDYLQRAEKNGRVRFHDNDEVIPGIDVLYLGGHAWCSQAIRIQTVGGPVIVASDEIYHYDLLEKGVIARLHTTPERLIAATEKLTKLASRGATLLPCHEPLLAETYQKAGESWLRRIKLISDKAAQGFARAQKQILR